MESYKKLPKDVQDAITSVDTADILRQIGDEKNMMIDKIGELADETGLVLLGFTHPSQFVSRLAERLGIEKTLAKEIAEQVNTRIFFSIRENLKKIHGLREEEVEEEAEAEKTPPAPPTPTMPSTPMPEISKEIKPPEIPILSQINEEIPENGHWESPIAPASPLLPSALIPEPVILETTLPKPETAPLSPLMPLQSEIALPEVPVQPVTSIFEAKTKEGVLRLPAEVTEKKAEETKKVDPYREPTT